MENAPANISTIRTTEDIINVLSILHFNLNEIERIYYDMFINKDPMDVTFWRYDDKGVLGSITLPNRAKDRIQTLIGVGSPNGVVEAKVGAFYLDSALGTLYVKSFGSDSSGWTQLWDSVNLTKDINFLTPTGDASQLTNLNMDNAGSGVLAVGRGGTGASGITGIVKGNGESAFTAAVDGVDFFGPKSLTGAIVFFPNNDERNGWLPCNGASVSKTTYRRLYDVIGTTYGEGETPDKFRVPNLINYYIRCWDGSSEIDSVQLPQVGGHIHTFSGNTGIEGNHTHGPGTLNITGTFPASEQVYEAKFQKKLPSYGAFYHHTSNVVSGSSANDKFDNDYWGFSANRAWTGATGAGSGHSHSFGGSTDDMGEVENRVLSKMLFPMIKY